MANFNSGQTSSAFEDFEKEIARTIAYLDSKNSKYFYKRISKSSVTEAVKGQVAYAFEFPYKYLMVYGSKFRENVTFKMMGIDGEWPIVLTVRYSKDPELPNRVFAYGAGGWLDFFTHHQIRINDVIFVILKGDSRFLITVLRAPSANPPPSFVYAAGVEVPLWDPNDHPPACKLCQKEPNCPQFVVTIRPSQDSEDKPSLDVPGEFWELHRRMLRSDVLQLQGPNEAVMLVKAERIYHEEEHELSVSLETGWDTFVHANELQVGDNLMFVLKAPSCFTVELQARIKRKASR